MREEGETDSSDAPGTKEIWAHTFVELRDEGQGMRSEDDLIVVQVRSVLLVAAADKSCSKSYLF